MSSITINEFSQKLSLYNFTWKSSSTLMTFQIITLAKPSHMYLVVKPYLDLATASKPYLASWNPQQHALHTQWKSISNRIFILNDPLSEISICACAFVSSLHVLLSFLIFLSTHMLLYPHCNSLPLHVFTKLASKVTYKPHMLSNKLCCSVKIKNK